MSTQRKAGTFQMILLGTVNDIFGQRLDVKLVKLAMALLSVLVEVDVAATT